MKTIAALTAVALALTAAAASAAQGDKITALGYGHSQQQAKIVTIQTWTAAAQDAYGYADWNTAYIGHMECVQNYAAATSQFSTLSREVIKVGGDQNAPWSCIVSGYQDIRTGYDTGYNGHHVAPSYQAPAYVAPGYTAPTHVAPTYAAPVYKAPVYKAPVYKSTGYSNGYSSGYSSGYVSKY